MPQAKHDNCESMVKYIRSTESPNVTRQERISHANRLLDLLSQRQERGELFRNLMVESKLECNRRAGPLDGQNANIMNLTKRVTILTAVLFVASTSVYLHEQQNSKDAEVLGLIAELYTNAWQGPENHCESPMCWHFKFTEPMKKILEIGSPAQELLLEKVDDPKISDQVIILLGGVGDERTVAPIIRSMIAEDKIAFTPNAERINLSANLALTNVTVAEVIWHHGGGPEMRKCPENPKECWAQRWKKNEATFTVKGIKQSRRYSNYQNYGIYRQQ